MKRILPILLSLISFSVLALETLGVVGAVVDAKPYYEQFILKSHNGKAEVLTSLDQARANTWSGTPAAYDSGLTAQQFSPVRFDKPLTQLLTPICLIANDAVSLDWLKRHQTTLTANQAVCYLIRTSGVGDLDALKQKVAGITIVSINPAFVIEQYEVPGYPALISRQGIEQ